MTKPRGRFVKPRRLNGSQGRRDLRGWLDPRKRHDVGRKQQPRPMCNCGAYTFPGTRRKRPHRMFAGKCSMSAWVESFFEPFKDECRDCGCFDDREMSCQVVEGIEGTMHCPELREFIRYEGIVLYGKARKAFERATGSGVKRHQSCG